MRFLAPLHTSGLILSTGRELRCDKTGHVQASERDDPLTSSEIEQLRAAGFTEIPVDATKFYAPKADTKPETGKKSDAPVLDSVKDA